MQEIKIYTSVTAMIESIALKGTERLSLNFKGPVMDGEEALKDFIPQFIKVASEKANILE